MPYGSNDPAAMTMFNEQVDAVSYEMQVGKASWADCFKKGNKTRYRTILGMTLQAGQQLVRRFPMGLYCYC